MFDVSGVRKFSKRAKMYDVWVAIDSVDRLLRQVELLFQTHGSRRGND